jgi:pilus assembly protein Flp/PilA
MKKVFLRRLGRHRGQTLVEYALILAIISVVAIGVLITMGGQIKTIYSNVNTSIASAQACH